MARLRLLRPSLPHGTFGWPYAAFLFLSAAQAFAGSHAGGDRAAAIYTLVQSAKLNGLNPETYLRDVLARIAEGHSINRISELAPWRMAPDTVPKPQ